VKECSGNHPSGVVFSRQETMRVSLKVGQHNAMRPDHVSAVLVQYVTRQALRSGRVPMLDSMEVYIAADITGNAVVQARCTVEPYEGDWACMVRGIEATRIEQMLSQSRAVTRPTLVN
jgi:hypothetical protein